MILDINAQSDKNYYQIEENGYFTNPHSTSNGVVFTDNYASRIYLLNDSGLNILVEAPGCGRYFSVSPDGKKIGYKQIEQNGNQTPYIFDLVSNQYHPLYESTRICGQPSFDNIGGIYFSVRDSLIVITLDKRESFFIGNYSNIIAPSSEGNFIAFSNSNGSLSILNTSSGEISELYDTENAVYPQWSPDETKLNFNIITGELFVCDRLTAKVIEIGTGGSPTWMNNSQGIVYQHNEVEVGFSFSSELFYFDIETREQVNLTKTPLISECNPSFSDSVLVFQTYDKREIWRAGFDVNSLQIVESSIIITWLDTLSVKFYKTVKPQMKDYSFLGDSPYINQVYDTPNFHNGMGGCGPTTAVMTLAYYNRLPEWPTEIDKLFLHVNNYGSYIADMYHFNEYFYDTYTSPYGSDSWGAHSFMWSGSGSPNSTMANYYENHLLSTSQLWTTQCSFQKTVDEIDNGFPHTICAFMTAAGHILMAKGYDDMAHSLIFHDPYGDRNTPGYPSYDGNDVIYDWPGYNNGNQNLDPDGSHGGVAWTITTQTDLPVYNDTIIDDMDFDEGFYIFNEPPSHMKYFRDQDSGYNNHSWWTLSINSDSDVCFVTWEPTITEAGYYEVSTFIPSDFSNAEQSNYKLHLSGVDTNIVLNQNEYSNEWALLGWFNLHPDSLNQIYLGDNSGVYDQSMVFDAMMFSRTPTVGVREISQDDYKVSVYPNPASDFVNIKLENIVFGNPVLLEIFNLNMQLVDSYQLVSEVDNKITVPVSGYRNGSYLIRLSSDNWIYHSRFVILRS